MRVRPLAVIDWPTIAGLPPKRLCHSSSLRITARFPPGTSSSRTNERPSRGGTPRTEKKSAETRCTWISSGSPPLVRLTRVSQLAANCSNDTLCFFQSRKFAGETEFWERPRWKFFSQTMTMLSASRYASERRRTPLITLKMALFAPIPRASAITAVRVNPGFLRNERRP